ncbi:MAG: clostripain-related cysteine peptidase [Planctomycetes bacterium]|nr:clostripain-related cysteine peptidase [Planctomycetota bacterium]
MLAYIAGDNNLSDFGLQDIQEMCDVGASPEVHVGVEIDTYGEHEGSVRYEITEPDWTGTAHRTVIERLPEHDSGDPESLRAFLDWGLRRYPADHRLVVVWNHGSGFRAIRRDIGYDDFGSSMDMSDLEMAFRKAGITPTRRIGVLGFDACLMSMLEIAHHFRDQVEVLVGSQQTEPGDGWPYDEVLRSVKASGSPADLARRIVEVYIKSYRDQGMGNVTQSAIDLGETDAAIDALDALGKRLAAAIGAHRAAVRSVRMASQTFRYADYVDLIHLGNLLAARVPDPQVAAAAQEAVEKARASILTSGTFGQAVANANGLSVWFPSDPDLYLDYRAKYTALDFASTRPGWIEFLDAYHS